mmetsp:Transcript_43422/g.80918  ORF Transcript_43422/g.80918 Transcript_43422/m.80918 type:complete len:246 (-) Transcript_43422:435-1172(-)
MASNHQVQAKAGVQRTVPPRIMTAREVGDKDLPVCPRTCQLRFHPRLLFCVKAPKPSLARIHRSWAPSGCAAGIWSVVLPAAHVVLRIFTRILGVHRIAVVHDVVDGEAQIWIGDMLAPIRGRHSPAGTGPCVSDLLVPSVVKLSSSPVVVSKDAQPRLSIETRPVVDSLIDVVKLMSRSARNSSHRCAATVDLNTTPVKVVSHVQDVVGIFRSSSFFEDICHQILRTHVHLWHKTTSCRAAGAM